MVSTILAIILLIMAAWKLKDLGINKQPKDTDVYCYDSVENGRRAWEKRLRAFHHDESIVVFDFVYVPSSLGNSWCLTNYGLYIFNTTQDGASVREYWLFKYKEMKDVKIVPNFYGEYWGLVMSVLINGEWEGDEDDGYYLPQDRVATVRDNLNVILRSMGQEVEG